MHEHMVARGIKARLTSFIYSFWIILIRKTLETGVDPYIKKSEKCGVRNG